MSPKSIRSSRESPINKDAQKNEKSKKLYDSDIERNMEKNKRNKKRYQKCGSMIENEPLNKTKNKLKKTQLSYENEHLLKDKFNNVKITKRKT